MDKPLLDLSACPLSQELLATIDSICDQLDITRSQFFRRALIDRVKSYTCEQSIEPPRNVQLPTKDGCAQPSSGAMIQSITIANAKRLRTASVKRLSPWKSFMRFIAEAKQSTADEARRIAVNITKLPELWGK